MIKSLKRKYIKIKKKLLLFLSKKKHLTIIYSFFNTIISEEYILIKKSVKFPHIPQGSDFDLYVSDEDEFSKLVVNYFKKFDNYEIIFTESTIGSIQLDLLFKEKFVYKFDLFDSTHLPNLFNKSFLEDSLSKKIIHYFQYKNKEMRINIPSIPYENLIRFVEYEMYPEKIHHLVHLDKLSDDEKSELKVMVKKYTNL